MIVPPTPPMPYPASYVAADEMSAANQKRYMEAIRYRLVFLALAALGGAVTMVGPVDWFAWLALVAFLAAIVCEVFILTARPDERWYEGRAAAESAKTITWRFAVGGDPFGADTPSDKAVQLLIDQLRDVAEDLPHVSRDLDGEELPDELMALRGRPFEQRREHYLKGRVQDQVRWYRAKAKLNARNQIRFLLITIVLEFVGVLGAVLRIADVVDVDLLGVIAAVAAGAASWAQTRQYGQLSRAYAVAANELAIIEAQAKVQPEDRWSRFVDEAEEAISREHTLWRASRGVAAERHHR